MAELNVLNRLVADFGQSLYQKFYKIIEMYGYSDDPKDISKIPDQIITKVAEITRESFHTIWHVLEQQFYMYSVQEKVYVPIERDQLMHNAFAVFTKAQEDVIVSINKPWVLVIKESSFRKSFLEGLRAYRGETDGKQEANFLMFLNNTVKLNVQYSPEDIAPGGKLFSGNVPDYKEFHTHTLNAVLIPVFERPSIWGNACRLMGFDTPEMMNAIEDILLYLLSPSLVREEMFYWYGRGSNGKSVIIKFITRVVGARHTASVSLDDLQDSSFAWHALLGKRLNLPSESGSSAYVESEKLKAVITGDQITINRKNKDHISVVLAVKFVFAMNRQPVFSERTHAIYRRFRMVVFDREVADHEKITDFHEVLLQHRDEIVSWWLINHLRRYGQFNPKFELPEIFETWRQDALRGEGDPIVLFTEECLQFVNDPTLEVDIQAVRNAFKAYCIKNGVDTRKWGDTVIGRKFSDEFGLISKHNPNACHAAKGSVKVTRNNTQKRVYQGLRLIGQK